MKYLAPLLLLVAACAAPPTSLPSETDLPPPRQPRDVVDEFFRLLDEEEYGAMDELVIDGHIPLLSLTEYDDPAEVAGALADETQAGINFWRSFRAGIGGLTGAEMGEVTVVGERYTDIGTKAFVAVEVSWTGQATIHRLLLQRERTWMVDPLATFSPAVASRLTASVGDLLGNPSKESDQVLAALRAEVDSLSAATELWPAGVTSDEAKSALERLTQLLRDSGP